MNCFYIDGVEVMTDVDDMTEAEARYYLTDAESKSTEPVEKMEIYTAYADMLDVKYACRRVKFERIRRITGYLVGTIDRWNDAKRAEEHDRVKHMGQRNG